MTRAELLASVQHLKWARREGRLRCEMGDCPIIAAARLKGLHLNNVQWPEAARELGLSYEAAMTIVRAADDDNIRIPELEPNGGTPSVI